MGHKIRKHIFLLLLCLGLSGCASWPGQGISAYSGYAGQEAAEDGGSDQSLLPEGAADGGSDQSLLPEGAVDGGSDQGLPSENGHGTGNLSAGEESASAEISESAGDSVDKAYDFTICFAGDINLDENWYTTQFLDTQPGGIYDCISPELVEVMQAADIMMLNNEFAYSNRGAPLEEKQFTFRAKPETVSYLNDMGVDLVSLANNHAYDYGPEALTDTLDTLREAGIPYVGAGRNISEAARPVYYIVGDMKIAFVSATQIERLDTPDTKEATETSPGVFRCWNGAKFLEAVREAAENSDFVVAYVHWGTENQAELDWAQLKQAPELAAAGADLIIGDHPHCLQPIGVIQGVPVIYSLGNFWFNSKTLDTGMVEVVVDEAGIVSYQFIPCLQSGCRTTLLQGTEKERVLSYIRSISEGVRIDEEGFVSW